MKPKRQRIIHVPNEKAFTLVSEWVDDDKVLELKERYANRNKVRLRGVALGK